MLIGAHVSTAGGLEKALERGAEVGAEAIQVFNQSPRAWRPTAFTQESCARVRERVAAGPVGGVVIHAVYLINCASDDPVIREKSLASLVHALRLGDGIGAHGVVLHPGSRKAGDLEAALERVAEALRHALGESERCPVLLEDTAGAGGTIGRSFEELADLISRLDGHARVRVCLDSCHLLASGYDVRTIDGVADVVDRFDATVGLDRLTCLHVNDSKTPLGSNRDRHELLPDGQLGREGLAAFLSEPRFEGLPALLETDAGREQVALARGLRAEGVAARALSAPAAHRSRRS